MNMRWRQEGGAHIIESVRTVGLVDDDARIRDAARGLIASDASLRLVFEAASLTEARARLSEGPVDVLLLDLGLPDGEGTTLLSTLSKTVVIVLTVFDDDRHIFDALRAGASGYLLKDEIVTRLVPAIGDALSGGAPMSPSVARRVLESFRAPPADPDEVTLTAREIDVVELIARGATYDEIGRMLQISTNTVRTHIRGAYDKLHVCTKVEATHEAVRRGLIRRID